MYILLKNKKKMDRCIPANESRSVDFPEPEGPMIAMIRDG